MKSLTQEFSQLLNTLEIVEANDSYTEHYTSSSFDYDGITAMYVTASGMGNHEGYVLAIVDAFEGYTISSAYAITENQKEWIEDYFEFTTNLVQMDSEELSYTLDRTSKPSLKVMAKKLGVKTSLKRDEMIAQITKAVSNLGFIQD